MVNVFRKFQRPLMLITTVLMIIAFVLLYNGTQFDQITKQATYSVYGRKLTQLDIDRSVRRFQVAQSLGLNELLFGLVGQAFTQQQATENFVWNSFVLDHEAKKLGIVTTPEEMMGVIQKLPNFQTNEQFDPMKYRSFVEEMLIPNGFTDAQLEELVRDDIRLKKLMALVGSTLDVSPEEFQRIYTQNNQKVDISLIRLPLSEFSDAVHPTDEEIQKYFDSHKATLMTDERRIVSYVQIDLDEASKKLTGKERVDALQKVSDKTRDFGQALLEEGATFADTAQKMGLPVQTTGEFSLSQPPTGLGEGNSAAEAVREAFKLVEGAPASNPIATESGFIVLHLDKVIPKTQLTLDEAKPRIISAIKTEQGRNALTARANELHTKIAEALKEGKTFAEAAAANDVVVKSFPPFSLSEPINEPNAVEITTKSAELPVGGLSGVIPAPDEAILVYVNSRAPIDEAKMQAEEASQMENLRQFKRFTAFNEWLSEQRKEANPHSIQPKGGAPEENNESHEGHDHGDSHAGHNHG